jgi:hypothetical protein
MSISVEPAGIGVPDSSVSRVANRVMLSSGVSRRRLSSIASSPDQLVLPPGQRLLPKGRRDQGAVTAVLRIVHSEHDVLAHDRAHDQVDDVRGGERLGVAQHPHDVLVAIDEEDRLLIVVRHVRGIEALHGVRAQRPGQLRVGVAHITRDAVVEQTELESVQRPTNHDVRVHEPSIRNED